MYLPNLGCSGNLFNMVIPPSLGCSQHPSIHHTLKTNQGYQLWSKNWSSYYSRKKICDPETSGKSAKRSITRSFRSYVIPLFSTIFKDEGAICLISMDSQRLNQYNNLTSPFVWYYLHRSTYIFWLYLKTASKITLWFYRTGIYPLCEWSGIEMVDSLTYHKTPMPSTMHLAVISSYPQPNTVSTS